jgi:hypothetical protein
MDEYLFSGERVLVTRGANFLLSLEEHKLRRLGVVGVDSEMRLLCLPEGDESIGGWLYLTDFRLFFRSHNVNRWKGTFSIFLTNVTEIKDISEFISKVLEVITPSYDYKFIVWGVPKLIAAIAAARDSLSPDQNEAMQNAARNAPEKCGDGLKVSPPVMDFL